MAIGLSVSNLGVSLNRSPAWSPSSPLSGESVNFWAKGRSGLTMPDSVGVNDVSILTPTFKWVGNSIVGSGGLPERIFDGGSYTLYFKIKQTSDIPSSWQFLFKMGNSAASERGFSLYATPTILYSMFADGVNNSEVASIGSNFNAVFTSSGWVDCFIEIDKAANRARFSMFKEDGSALGTAQNKDISTWTFNANNNGSVLNFNNARFAVMDVKKFSALKTIAQCRDNSYITDLQFFYPTISDGTDVSGNNNHLIRSGAIGYTSLYYSNKSTYLMDYGYSIYRSVNKISGLGYEDVYVPNTPAGVPIVRTTFNDPSSDAYVKVGEFAGSLIKHNLADSLLTIPGWDKSDTSIFEDVVRTGNYYDASNPTRWHPSELDYLLFTQKCKAGHKGLDFFKVSDNSLVTEDRKFIDELFSFNTDKIGSDLNKILTYTKDQSVLNSAIQLFCDGSIENNINFDLTGILGTDSIQVYWGDGTKKELIVMDGTVINVAKHYSGTSLYPIYIVNPANISGIEIRPSGTFDLYPKGANIGEFSKAVNLLKLTITDLNTTVLLGSINGLNAGLKHLKIGDSHMPNGKNLCSGGVARFTDLETLYIFGSNTIGGDATGCTKLKNVFIAGYNTIYGSVAGWMDIIQIEGQGSNDLIGTLADKTHIEVLCLIAGVSGGLTGDISARTTFKYLSHDGNLSGSISNLINLWMIGVSGSMNLTGSLNLLTKLEELMGGSNITKPVRFINNPLLSYFEYGTQNYSSAETNQLLADLVTNKDSVGRVSLNGYRTIKIQGVPTLQGIIDKAALQAYRSPTPPGTAALWTIDTN